MCHVPMAFPFARHRTEKFALGEDQIPSFSRNSPSTRQIDSYGSSFSVTRLVSALENARMFSDQLTRISGAYCCKSFTRKLMFVGRYMTAAHKLSVHFRVYVFLMLHKVEV